MDNDGKQEALLDESVKIGQEIDKANEPDHLIETLAALEHQRWADWQSHVHSKCVRQDDGSLLIPSGLAEAWERQISTPYHKLSEREKECDRAEVRRYLPTVLRALDERDELRLTVAALGQEASAT